MSVDEAKAMGLLAISTRFFASLPPNDRPQLDAIEVVSSHDNGACWRMALMYEHTIYSFKVPHGDPLKVRVQLQQIWQA